MPVPDSDWPLVLPVGSAEWNDEGTQTVPDAGAKETHKLIVNGQHP
jgi:hypothetical protein